MYSMNYYGYVSNDYLCHYGVKGMKWYQHVMAKVKTSVANRVATNRAVKSEKKKILDSYKAKTPTSNLANSAAKKYYRSLRGSKSEKSRQKAETAARRKQAALTDEQIASGRYRVANARNIRRKVLSTTVGTLTGGGLAAATVATGGLATAALLGVGVGSVVGVKVNSLSGGHFYAQEAKAYGSARAEYQAREAVAARNN